MSYGRTVSPELLEAEEARLARPAKVLVTSRIVVVERNDRDGYECPVMGSTQVRALAPWRDDLAFIVDGATNSRLNRWDLSDATRERFDELARTAVPYGSAVEGDDMWHVRVDFIVSEKTQPILLDETTETIYASGSWRSGKTTAALQHFVRAWMLRGGWGRRMYIVGPDLDHAYRVATKIFHGRDGTDPIVPVFHGRKDAFGRPVSVLADGIPRSARAANTFPWLDGTIAELHHGKGDGTNLEGESVFEVLYDEIVRSKSSKPYHVCRGRVIDTRGQVVCASVPDDGDNALWVHQEIVTEADRQKDDPSPNVRMHTLSGFDNPWVDPDFFQRFVDGCTDPIQKAQKGYGQWVVDALYAYTDVWKVEFERDELSHESHVWGYGPDITSVVAQQLFGCKRPADYLFGADFNGNPQSRLLAKVFGEEEDWDTWTLVLLDEIVTRCDAEQAAEQMSYRKGGMYKGAAGVADANGFHVGHQYGGQKSKTNDVFYFKREGFHVVAPIATSKPHQPIKYSNCAIGESRTILRNRMRAGRLIVNAGACPRVVNAIKQAPNRPKRDSEHNTWLEREIYGIEDCLRYIGYRLWRKHVMTFSTEQPKLQLVEVG